MSIVQVEQGPSTLEQASSSSSPSVLSSLQINSQKSPQVAQLTSPKRSLMSLSQTELGSFANMEVQALVATAKEMELKESNKTSGKSLSETPKISNTSSVSVTKLGPSHSPSGLSSTFPQDKRTLPGFAQTPDNGGVQATGVAQNKPLNATTGFLKPLEPGVHRISSQPSSRTLNAAVGIADLGPSTRTPCCLPLTMSSMGVPIMPKANCLGSKYVPTYYYSELP